MLQLQRADAEQVALRSDQGGAAPVRMRRRSEDRLVEHVFPIAGEFLLGDDARGHRAGAATGAADHHPLADRHCGRAADLERRHVELGERLNEAEPGFLVVAERVARHRAAVAQGEPNRFRLGDQITDGEDKAIIATEHAMAGALGAQRLRGESVRRNDRVQPDHCGERAIEVIAVIPRFRLGGGRNLPVAHGRHLAIPSAAGSRSPVPVRFEPLCACRGRTGNYVSGCRRWIKPTRKARPTACRAFGPLADRLRNAGEHRATRRTVPRGGTLQPCCLVAAQSCTHNRTRVLRGVWGICLARLHQLDCDRAGARRFHRRSDGAVLSAPAAGL